MISTLNVCLHALASCWQVSLNQSQEVTLNTSFQNKWLHINLTQSGTSFLQNWKVGLNILHTIFNIYLVAFEWKNKLRYVRIYFDTPTFDKITKDRAAKFVDMLSAIGGTMGLLTGFSIISGVEIVYFATKIIVNIMRNKIQ